MCPWAHCDAVAKAVFQHIVNCKARLRTEEFSLFMQLFIYSKSSWDNNGVVAKPAAGRAQAAVEPRPQPLHGLEGQAAACTTHDVLDQLRTIQQPALVVGGREDIFTPFGWRKK